MSKALFCDRCLQFTKDEPHKVPDPKLSAAGLDLCSNCWKAYACWFKAGCMPKEEKW